MHHAVSDGGQLVLGSVGRLQPVHDMGDRAVVPELGALRPALLARRLRRRVLRDEMGARVDAFDLADATTAGSTPASANSENLMLDEPAFRTRIASAHSTSFALSSRLEARSRIRRSP